MKERPFVSGVLLAAGLSSRFGSPKQLARLGGEAMAAMAVKELKGSSVDEVVVVLGHDAARVKAVVRGEGVRTVLNREYKTGLSSSLKRGIGALDERSEAAVIVLSDQPFVTRRLIDRVVKRFRETGARAVAATSGDVLSPPVLISKVLYPEVSKLTGDSGAKSLVVRQPGFEKVRTERETLLDIDTEEDLRQADEFIRRGPGAGRPLRRHRA